MGYPYQCVPEEVAVTNNTTQVEAVARCTPRFEYAFTIALTLGEVHWVKPTTQGSTRGAVYVTGGTVDGPEIRGIVIPQSGADWPLLRPDGVIDFDARYLLRTDD